LHLASFKTKQTELGKNQTHLKPLLATLSCAHPPKKQTTMEGSGC